jgi:hypothetical protein
MVDGTEVIALKFIIVNKLTTSKKFKNNFELQASFI